MKKLILPIGVVAGIFLWHIRVSFSLEHSQLRVNPLSDVVTIESRGTEPAVNPTERAIFENGISLLATPVAENKLNLFARQRFDIYAWLVPYRVSVGVTPITSASPPGPSAMKSSDSMPVNTHIYHVADIQAEFEANPTRATALHRGTIMFVQGVGGKLFTNAKTGDHVLMLHDQDTHDSFVACRMTDSDLAILAERNDPGTVIVLSGECLGWIDGALWFKRCKLEEVVR